MDIQDLVRQHYGDADLESASSTVCARRAWTPTS